MKPLFDISQLLHLLNQGAVIITSNNRLASKITQAYMQAEFGSVRAPQVYSIKSYFHKHWNNAIDLGFEWAMPIATPCQSKHLFQAAIKSSASEELLMGVTMLGNHSEKAYKALKLAMLNVSDIPEETTASINFKRWCTTYEASLKLYGLTNELSAMQALADNPFFSGVERAVLVGFEQISRLHKYLLSNAFKSLDSFARDNPTSAKLTCISATSEDKEVELAANWAMEKLQQNKNVRIGIIDPNLGKRRDLLERGFTKVFDCHGYSPVVDRYVLPFNFSAGYPLGSAPIVADALELLGLAGGEWPVDQLLNLIRSPFWGDRESYLQERCELERIILKLQRHDINYKTLMYVLSKSKIDLTTGDIGILYSFLSKFVATHNTLYTTKKPSEWASEFVVALREVSWGSNRKQDTVEYQQVIMFYSELESFCLLDQIGVSFTRQGALSHLKQLLIGSSFQPKTADSPIQILGALEGAGLQFDYTWVMGMNQESWPPAAEPNPLLPVEFQVLHDMPRCNPDRELSLATALINEFIASTLVEAKFSYPEMVGDTEVSPSAFVRTLPIENLSCRESPLSEYSALLKSETQWVSTYDFNGPELELEKSKGGATILKDQADCPFNAFAKHRLGAFKKPQAFSGIPPTYRGNLIHDVLGVLWSNWKSTEIVNSLSKEDLSDRVRTVVTQVALQRATSRADLLTPNFLKIEINRVTNLIVKLVELEISQRNFNVVSVEESYECIVGKLTLKLRLDRKDQMATGEFAVVDFKTGINSDPRSWFGERPSDPQLPLYAISDTSKPEGIMFMNCNTRKLSCEGLGVTNVAQNGIVDINNPISKAMWAKNLPSCWSEMIEEWERVLTSIANEYSDGYAKISFASPESILRSEELLPLNRFNELK